ncbi:MAG: TraB/GumN family protein [Desulfobacteraceae bacterium]|nr:MAG: TraB/GumN family protein [Desulfobacteraceae bacterium]
MSLDKVLSNKTYDLLKRYCEASGIPVRLLNRFKPPMVVLTLLALELQRLGVDQTGVDIYFHNKATNEGKKVKWLESVKEQMEFVLSMGKGNENDFIEQSIRDLKKTKEITNELIVAWKQGNDDKLYSLFVSQMKDDYPDLYKTMLVERNRQWLPKIERYVQDSQKELVLIGVGHLVGEEGIIQYLRRQGYRINKLD